jgi:6-phosphogluconolactonase
MTEKSTPYGRLFVGAKDELFAKSVLLAIEQQQTKRATRFTWALTGGSTPAEWYKWAVTSRAIPSEMLGRAVFTVSDERHVPLASDQSNFGNAERQFLDPLQVGTGQRRPWPTSLPPAEAAAKYASDWAAEFGSGRGYDLCFLGMGDDAHTASLFPGSPLLNSKSTRVFEAVEVPGKGWRLTITPHGLNACGLIVVMTLGAGKAAALKKIMTGAYDPTSAPSQILKSCAPKVVWLVDAAAASAL